MEEYIFKKAYAFFTRLRTPQKSAEEIQRTVTLQSMKPTLLVLARCLTGENINILRAEREGGWSGSTFFLPDEYSACATKEQNEDFYLFRTCYVYMQRKCNYNWQTKGSYTVEESRIKAEETSGQVLQEVFNEFPRLQEVYRVLYNAETTAYRKQPDYSMLYGRWMNPTLTTDIIDTTKQPDAPQQKQSTPTTELEANAIEEIETYTINKEKIQEYTLSHSFEKAETIEEFQGHWRDTDGSDELAEHEEALRDLKLRQTIRTDDATHSVLRAELVLNSNAPESASLLTPNDYFVSYPEWDVKKRVYKENYCKVFPSVAVKKDNQYIGQVLQTNKPILAQLRKQLSLLYNDFENIRRQPKGIEPDLDEVTDAFADIHAGRTPSENVYISRRKRNRDVSLLLLADTSLSTDSFTDNKRVIDVEKQAMILFGEVLAQSNERFQIDTFASQTRNRCTYQTLKSFGRSWADTRDLIGGIQPHGYTRIGPAIRHATSILQQETSRHRWIILLSDGKPNDYDRYEGRYGIEDVRQAVREANQQHIHIYALAVESEAKFYFPQLFGAGSYRILPHPAMLPEALAELYSRLAM